MAVGKTGENDCSGRLFARFHGDGEMSLADLSLLLLKEQLTLWPELRTGHIALAAAKKRRIRVSGSPLVLQCNPRRIDSTTASLDPVSLKARPCFLCRENLPEAQQGILYRDKFLILCNPAPIAPAHFTIALIEHFPQSLLLHLSLLLEMARDFSPSFALLYNGPRCGASAPDHLHFQALIRTCIPDLDNGALDSGRIRRRAGTVTLSSAERAERPAVMAEGADKEALACFLISFVGAMKKVLAVNAEPMLNLFCLYDGGKWRVLIYPRRRHRPDVFFRSGGEQVLIAPGAVEMGGLLVLPREEDFDRLDAVAIRDIFLDVALDREKFEEIIEAV